MRLHEDLFAHQLSREKTIRKIRQIVFRIEIRTFRQFTCQMIHQVINAVSGTGAQHKHIFNADQAADILRQRQQFFSANKIRLV